MLKMPAEGIYNLSAFGTSSLGGGEFEYTQVLPGLNYGSENQSFVGGVAGVATMFVPGLGLVRGGRLVEEASAFETIAKSRTANLSDVWNLPPTARGNVIEAQLARTEYKEWFNVGQLYNGKFPLVDFQNGNVLVSLKTVDTRGTTWLGRIEDHIYDLGASGATINGTPAKMVLDLRVQPGGAAAAQALVTHGANNNVVVIIKELR